jgi:uncharacterized membrane protein
MSRRFSESFQRYFARGLLAFLPIVLTVWICGVVIRLLERGVDFLPRALRPAYYFDAYYMPGIGAVFTVLLIWGIGVIATHLVSQKANYFWDRALQRIPFVSGIYRSINQVVQAIFTHDTRRFRSVVLVEYPRKGLYALALVTGVPGSEVVERIGDRLLSVYIPKAPNPTNGWYAIVPERETIPLEMTVEDAFKVVMSGGLVFPEREVEVPRQIASS